MGPYRDGWKGDRPWVRLKERTGEPARSPKIISDPSENCPQGAWNHIAEEMLLEFAESGHPIFRSTTPLSRGQLKSKGRGKYPYTSLQIKIQLIQFIALFFLSISSVSTEQWQPYARNLKTIKIERGNL